MLRRWVQIIVGIAAVVFVSTCLDKSNVGGNCEQTLTKRKEGVLSGTPEYFQPLGRRTAKVQHDWR